MLHGCATFRLFTHLSLDDVSISRSTFAYVSEGRVWSGPLCPRPERRVVALDLLIHSIPSDCCSEVRGCFPQQACVGVWAFWRLAWVRPWASGRAAMCPKGLSPFCRDEPSVCWWAGRVEGELWPPGADAGREMHTHTATAPWQAAPNQECCLVLVEARIPEDSQCGPVGFSILTSKACPVPFWSRIPVLPANTAWVGADSRAKMRTWGSGEAWGSAVTDLGSQGRSPGQPGHGRTCTWEGP